MISIKSNHQQLKEQILRGTLLLCKIGQSASLEMADGGLIHFESRVVHFSQDMAIVCAFL
jgi:hypothetical protein